jgi:hypothetical protein
MSLFVWRTLKYYTSLKKYSRPNTLAYFASGSVTKQKSFITTPLVLNTIKLFSTVIYEFLEYAKAYVLGKPLGLV